MLLNEPTLVSFNRIIFTTSLYFSLWVNTSVPAFVRPSFALTSIRITSPLFCVTKSIFILKLSFHSCISLVIFLLNSISPLTNFELSFPMLWDFLSVFSTNIRDFLSELSIKLRDFPSENNILGIFLIM